MMYLVKAYGGAYEDAWSSLIYLTHDRDKAEEVRGIFDAQMMKLRSEAEVIFMKPEDYSEEAYYKAVDDYHNDYTGTVVVEIPEDEVVNIYL